MVAVLVWCCCVARTRVTRAVRCLSARVLRRLPLGSFGAFRSGCAWWQPIPHGSPTMSHVIPPRVFQTLKSCCWNCNVCGVSRKMTKLNYVRLLGGAGLGCGVYLLGSFGVFRSGPSAPSARVLRRLPLGLRVVAAYPAWFPNNVARNSPARISDFEIMLLELQRLWDVSKNDQVKLRATFRGRGVGVWCLSARVLRRLPLGPFGAFRSGPSAPSARAARGGSLSRMVPQQCRT